MTPCVTKDLSKEDTETFSAIRKIMENLPDIELGRDENQNEILLSCHVLTRAFAEFFPVSVRDGEFLRGWEHSWLITFDCAIIDVCPWAAVGGPIIVLFNHCTPWYYLYSGYPLDYKNPEFEEEAFKRSVEKIIRAVFETIERLGITNFKIEKYRERIQAGENLAAPL